MPEQFDAYYKWLGIPPEEQPPHHYRLLGVSPFEADLDVIDNAADQRMTHVRTFQSGKHAAHSQKILNEISAAKVCLLNPARKTDYDKVLRGKLSAAAAAMGPPAAPPAYQASAAMPPGAAQVGYAQAPRVNQVAAPAPAATAEASHEDLGQIVTTSSKRRSAGRAKQKQSSLMLPIVVVVGLALILGGVVWALKFRGSGGEQVAKQPPTPKAKPKTEPPAEANGAKETASKESGGAAKVTEEPVPHDPAAVQKLLKHLATSVKAAKIEETDSVGSEEGKDFRDVPPSGALLSGFDLTLLPADSAGIRAISSLRPVFQIGERLIKPGQQTHGKEEESVIKVRAKTGYAVGALEMVPGDHVAGFRVQYCAITGTGLDPDKCYFSDWYGQPRKGRAVRLGDGRPVVGIVGAGSDIVNRLSLVLDAGESEGATAEKPKKPKGKTAAPDPSEVATSSEPPAVPSDTTPPVPVPSIPVPTPSAPGPNTMANPDDSSPRSFPRGPKPGDAPRIAVPDAEAQRAARATVHDLFKDQYAELTASAAKPLVVAEKKLALARKLFHAAEDEGDSTARYVLLDETRKLCTQMGDSQGVMDAIWALNGKFEIDDVQTTLDALEETSAAPSNPAFRRRLVENILLLISRAIVRERFDAAETLKELGIKAAKNAQDVMLQRQLVWRRDRLNEAHKAYDEAQKGLAALKSNPNDPAANLMVGVYRCFFQEDWKVGLPLLAKGSDATLKRLAEQELLPPTDAVAQVKLGDEWFGAERTDDSLSPYYQRRARQWYETAMSRLAGVTKLGVQAKLEKMLGGHGLKAEFFNGAGNLEDKVKSRVDAQVNFKWGGAPPEDLPSDQYTVRWSGWLSAPLSKNPFTIIVEHDAGARLTIDGKPVIDNLGRPGREEILYQLTKPRNIKLEYISKGGNANISLKWAQKDGFPEQVIPAEALFQERNAAEKGFGPLPVPRPIDDTPLVVYTPDEVPPLQPGQGK